MSLALHILRKDLRCLRVELLISLVALVALLCVNWWLSTGNATGGQEREARWLSWALVLSWCVLIVRLIQQETLVGGRQFWLTRPYARHQLLNAKLLFILVGVALPFVLFQTMLLWVSHVPLLPSFQPIALLTAIVIFLFIFPAAAIATLTNALSQWFLTVILLFMLMVVVLSYLPPLTSPRHPIMGEGFSITIQLITLAVFAIAAILIQYARRRRRYSISCLVSGFLATLLWPFALPDRAVFEHNYPATKSKSAPLQITFLSPWEIADRASRPQRRHGFAVFSVRNIPSPARDVVDT